MGPVVAHGAAAARMRRPLRRTCGMMRGDIPTLRSAGGMMAHPAPHRWSLGRASRRRKGAPDRAGAHRPSGPACRARTMLLAGQRDARLAHRPAGWAGKRAHGAPAGGEPLFAGARAGRSTGPAAGARPTSQHASPVVAVATSVPPERRHPVWTRALIAGATWPSGDCAVTSPARVSPRAKVRTHTVAAGSTRRRPGRVLGPGRSRVLSWYADPAGARCC